MLKIRCPQDPSPSRSVALKIRRPQDPSPLEVQSDWQQTETIEDGSTGKVAPDPDGVATDDPNPPSTAEPNPGQGITLPLGFSGFRCRTQASGGGVCRDGALG